MLNFGNKEFRNLQEQVLKNAQDIEILKERPGLKPVIVDELPETGKEGILYLVPSDDPETANVYNEYIWVAETESFEMVGSTQVDLSGLVTLDTPQTITAGKTFTSKVYLTNGAEVTGDVKATRVVVGADNYNIKKDGSNMVIEADGNPIKVRGDLLPNTGSTYTLGNASDNRWKTLYLSHYVDWGSGAMLRKDDSNRVCITNGSDDKIKVGASEVICKDNFSPDQDGTYTLGRSALRWSTVNASTLANDYSALSLKGKTGVNITCDNGSAVRPSTNGQIDLGGSSNKWNIVYANYISDGTNSVSTSNLVEKPDYSNPDVFESGTLDASGQGVIDMTQTGVPSDGLYMFTYGNCQCFLSLTSTMIQNAATYPIRCTCPMMYNGSAYPGILKIERAADILTLTVATAGVGNVTPAGFEWKLIKVM